MWHVTLKFRSSLFPLTLSSLLPFQREFGPFPCGIEWNYNRLLGAENNFVWIQSQVPLSASSQYSIPIPSQGSLLLQKWILCWRWELSKCPSNTKGSASTPGTCSFEKWQTDLVPLRVDVERLHQEVQIQPADHRLLLSLPFHSRLTWVCHVFLRLLQISSLKVASLLCRQDTTNVKSFPSAFL